METPPVRRFFLSLALFLLFLWALSHLYSLLLWVFLAFTLAGALDPLVGLFARRFPRPSAVFLAYLLVLGAMGLGFYLAAPLLVLQFHHLGEVLPQVLRWLEDNLGLTLPGLASSLFTSAHVAGDLLLRVGETVSQLVLALVLAVMIALEPHLVARVAPYLPGSGWTEVLEDTWRRMGYWARAQFLIALSFALLFGGWLLFLGVPSPFALGVLGGVLEVVPFVGGIATALLAFLVALSAKGPLVALLVLLGYGGIALLEGKVLIPYIYGRTVGFHPALVLLAIFAFGKLFGFLGIFLAVPMTILGAGILKHWRR
ncbi:AI-2E family transporter [Thermus sp. NEB1569]|uniref:AI-2E family transporter n=1 Tax=Thermus sp. NEB1569 TaxID=2918899 RepID=UPI001EFBF018|nr:AI-2E family transporter [Thermus sp. NEB1569]ULR41815.1 AI-2E family transporter [Thermus sp. NEB1569]